MFIPNSLEKKKKPTMKSSKGTHAAANDTMTRYKPKIKITIKSFYL